MSSDPSNTGENTPLLHQSRLEQLQREHDEEAHSMIASSVSKEERELTGSTVGERLPYNDYTTIDWLHDLVKESYRYRSLHAGRGLRDQALALFDACSGWIAVILIGALTACVAYVVDIAVVTVSDWKFGYCTTNFLGNRESCCAGREPLIISSATPGATANAHCDAWQDWSQDYTKSYAIYVGLAIIFGTISSSATMLTKSELPSVSPASEDQAPGKTNDLPIPNGHRTPSGGKTMYMASGSGIPELKTILSGFCIPSFLSLNVLLVKAFGAIFAVSTSLNLGKEGPFVHISTCVGYLVGQLFPKYRENGRKMRELLSAACSSGLSVAFGAPIGGVLFSYEEISSYFPRRVLWRAFTCSLVAAMVLRELNPTGTGKLVLFEADFSSSRYEPVHYVVFILLGVIGGLFGGVFCRLNFLWSKWFRSFNIIKRNPVLEVVLIVLVTTLMQFPNPLTKEPGDVVIKALLVDCNEVTVSKSYVCTSESRDALDTTYVLNLISATLIKLFLTIITFGIKVPSGVIIPALSAGALFGRLVGLLMVHCSSAPSTLSPGIFALVAAASFLAGVSRMTISLAVIMFELTSSLPLVVPNMLAILVAKCTADAISSEGVYDLAQSVLGHPFLDGESALLEVRKKKMLVDRLIPPQNTMEEITVHVPKHNCVAYSKLMHKLQQLRSRGLMDAGIVLVQAHDEDGRLPVLQGYISQSELEFCLTKLAPDSTEEDLQVRVLGNVVDDGPAPETLEIDMTPFVDRTPLAICAKAPLEYAVEMFAKLGLRYLCVTEEGTGKLVGVIIKKRLVAFLEHLREHGKDE